MEKLDEFLMILLVAMLSAIIPAVVVGAVIHFCFNVSVTAAAYFGIYILVALYQYIHLS